MARIIYGVWNGTVYDNRKKNVADLPDAEGLAGLDFFNPGNPVQAFFGDKGFWVFDASVNLLDALYMHMSKAAAESCGKCTPCRMGTKLVADMLDDLRHGKKALNVWADMHSLAVQIADTSLCGLGQTCATALLGALDHFQDQLDMEFARGLTKHTNALSYMTAPCIEACPSKVNVPRYISYLRDGKPTHSVGVILQKYPMAATCGRVCVHFCEMACRRSLVDEAVNIKILKRYVADYQTAHKIPLFSMNLTAAQQPKDMKVAVIGAGPAGVACAYHLLLRGIHADVFDAAPRAGGMAERGIPSYRLPKDVLQSETEAVETLGGSFIFNKKLGRDYSVNSLFDEGYKAVFLGIGCAEGARLGIEGEEPSLKGYEPGINFLLKVHHHVEGSELTKLEGEVIVTGGGNVAMDCARSAIRLGASKVHVVYRRTRDDMPADKMEIDAAEKEGIIFHYLTNPVKIYSEDGVLTGIEVAEMKQTEPDASGRRGVVAVEGKTYRMNCAVLIAAIGQQIDQETLRSDDGIETDKRGLVKVNAKTQETSRKGVFAGGDCSLGPATLIHAMANGLKAARGIEDYLRFGEVQFSPISRMQDIIRDNKMLVSDYVDVPVQSMMRVHHPELDPEIRREMFEEVDLNLEAADAYREAARCMRCYRVYTVLAKDKIPEELACEAPLTAAP